MTEEQRKEVLDLIEHKRQWANLKEVHILEGLVARINELEQKFPQLSIGLWDEQSIEDILRRELRLLRRVEELETELEEKEAKVELKSCLVSNFCYLTY